MMENAYVLITTEIDRHEEALQALRDNGSIKEAYAVRARELKNFVSTDIRDLPGVKSTLTMVVTS